MATNKRQLQDHVKASLILGNLSDETIVIFKDMIDDEAQRLFRMKSYERKTVVGKALRDIRKVWKQFDPANQSAHSYFGTVIRCSLIESQTNI